MPTVFSHRTLVIGVLLFSGAGIVTRSALASCSPNGTDYTCLVKTQFPSAWSCHSQAHPDEQVNFASPAVVSFIGFSALPPVTLWDGIHDPGHTGNPYREGNLITEQGLLVTPFGFHTQSLRDLGTYHYHLAGECADGFSAVPAVPGEAYFHVYNHAPTADMKLSGDPLVGKTITIASNADDADGGGSLNFAWSVAERPVGSTTTLYTGAVTSAKLTFLSHYDIGDWTIHLDVADAQGELKGFDFSFKVANRPPTIDIMGDTNINALTPIALQAGPAFDVDGESVTLKWDLVSSPIGATPQPSTNFSQAAAISIPTSFHEIGSWVFRCTATDGHGGSASAEKTVLVDAIPPKINLDGPDQIEVGQPFVIKDTIVLDAYGEPMHFKWELVQVPVSAGVPLSAHFSTADNVARNTVDNDAGTWIFKLTVTDAANQTTEASQLILIDAKPVAHIVGPNEITNDEEIDLNGKTSVDPDSPNDPPNNGHLSSQGTPQVSPGIVEWHWSVTGIPAGFEDVYVPGPVDDVFHVEGDLSKLHFDAHQLPAGNWNFELAVKDGEGNPDETEFQVNVVDAGADPIAVVLPFQVVGVGLNNFLATPLMLDGSNSFDPDNLIGLEPGSLPTAGLGITEYHWTPLITPPGCPPPALPSDPTVTYYAAGSIIPLVCQGFHITQLTVTDDDSPAHTGSAYAFSRIGNCTGNLCIDEPTTDHHVDVESSTMTKVMVYYHFNSALIVGNQFISGSRLVLVISNSSGTPFYTDSYEINPLTSDKGGQLAIPWDGYSNSNTRPPSGHYGITLKLLNPDYSDTGSQATEPDSIWIQTMELAVSNTTSKYLNHDALSDGSIEMNVDYTFAQSTVPASSFDELRYRVFTSSGHALVYTNTVANPKNGHFTWDGHLDSADVISTGTYTLELEALRAGLVLRNSTPYPFTVYHMDIHPTGSGVSKKAPGQYVFANTDDDNYNGVSDLLEKAAGEDDLVPMTVEIEPAIAGQYTLSSSTSIVRFWSDAAKSSPITSNVAFPAPLNGIFLYAAEGAQAGETSLTVDFKTADGVTLSSASTVVTVIDAKIVTDTDLNYRVTDADQQILSVKPGLWDFAFHADSTVPSTFNTLYNGAAENDNFVGRDSRRFYFVVRDPSADKDPSRVDEITMPWYTLSSTSPLVYDDKPPTHDDIHLTETGPHTGVFTSVAQMLVSDATDLNQKTNTGLAAHPGSAAYDATDHRTRRMTSLNDVIGFDYSPAAGVTHQWRVPVFSRAPDERLRLTVQVYNFQDPSDPSAPATTPAIVSLTTTTFMQRYLPLGIQVDIRYNPATDILDVPPGGLDLNDVGDFDNGTGTLQPSAGQVALIEAVRRVSPATDPKMLYIVYVGNFTEMNRGESFPDGWEPPANARNFTFLAGRAAGMDYIAAHEVGHMLTNAVDVPGMKQGTAPGWGHSGHYKGVNTDQNVMQEGPPHTSHPNKDSDNRRFWNDVPVHLLDQATLMRLTRFMKSFK